MLISTSKITSKGQVTLPKEVRDTLHTDLVTFEISDDNVIIKPIIKVSGSLKDYNKNISFESARKKALDEAVSEYDT